MTKIYLHIGQPKTATTTIQGFLSQNRPALIGKGWLYPRTACQYLAHHVLGGMFIDQPADWLQRQSPEKVRIKLRAEIDRTGCHSVVMSSESLFIANRWKAMCDFLADFDVHVVVFLRRQDEWIESAYQEQRKNGATRDSPASYLRRQYRALSYADRLDDWAQHFGRDRVIVHPFERSDQLQPVEDVFLNLIGAPVDSAWEYPAPVNERLSRDCIAYLENMQQARRLGHKFTAINRILSDYSKRHPDLPEHRYVWSPQQRRAIVAHYAEQNARVAARYLGRADGVLFANPLPRASDPWAEYPGLSVEKAVHIGEYVANALYDAANTAVASESPKKSETPLSASPALD